MGMGWSCIKGEKELFIFSGGKLVTELKDAFNNVKEIKKEWDKANSCLYLRAYIDKALHLSPPILALLTMAYKEERE
jgi:hypothetical protein